MLYLYEEVLLDKLSKWFGESSVSIVGDKNSLFTAKADESGEDRISLPMISLTRGDNYTILQTSKSAMSYRGKKYDSDSNNEKIYSLSAIPISVSYQLDIYTRHRKENDDIWRELIFKIINNPTLELNIPFDSEKSHNFTMRLSEDVADNSDIPEHLIKGEYFRSTLTIELDDIYLFAFKGKYILDLDVDVELVEKFERK